MVPIVLHILQIEEYTCNKVSGRTDSTDPTVYGGELRTIASANVYGNKGIEADGANYAFSIYDKRNFAYIGSW